MKGSKSEQQSHLAEGGDELPSLANHHPAQRSPRGAVPEQQGRCRLAWRRAMRRGACWPRRPTAWPSACGKLRRGTMRCATRPTWRGTTGMFWSTRSGSATPTWRPCGTSCSRACRCGGLECCRRSVMEVGSRACSCMRDGVGSRASVLRGHAGKSWSRACRWGVNSAADGALLSGCRRGASCMQVHGMHVVRACGRSCSATCSCMQGGGWSRASSPGGHAGAAAAQAGGWGLGKPRCQQSAGADSHPAACWSCTMQQ